MILSIDIKKKYSSAPIPKKWLKLDTCNDFSHVISVFQQLKHVGYILESCDFWPENRTEADALGGFAQDTFTESGKLFRNFYMEDEQARLPEDTGIDPTRVLFGCVTDNTPKYLSQALRLLQSVRWFSGVFKQSDMLICVVGDIDTEHVDMFQTLGATLRAVPCFHPLHSHSNKIQFFLQPDIYNYDMLILMDCDTLIVQDPFHFLNKHVFQAKIAALPTIPHAVFKRLFDYFGIPLPEKRYYCSFTGTQTIWYCNSGVLTIPTHLAHGLTEKWKEYNYGLSNRLDLLEPHQNFCDQASLSLAYAATHIPFKALPVSMNYQLNLPYLPFFSAMGSCDPVILHYHDRIDASGFLNPSHYPGVQKRIKLFNDALYQHTSAATCSNSQLSKKGMPDA